MEKKTEQQRAYTIRRVNIGKTAQLDALAHAAGQVYSRTLVFFWRTVRKQGIWLKPKHLMRLIPTDPDHLLHAHSVDAAVQSFFAGLASWRERRKSDPNANPPQATEVVLSCGIQTICHDTQRWQAQTLQWERQ
jgi:hypothetical protein